MEDILFSKVARTEYPGEGGGRFEIQKVEFENRIILNVAIDGAMNFTFDIPLSNRVGQPLVRADSANDPGVEPVLLLGDLKNIKMQVVATQIGKMVLYNGGKPKNVILTIGSRWFGDGNSTGTEDFNKLMFVLNNIKALVGET